MFFTWIIYEFSLLFTFSVSWDCISVSQLIVNEYVITFMGSYRMM